jgi:hypothetical protein
MSRFDDGGDCCDFWEGDVLVGAGDEVLLIWRVKDAAGGRRRRRLVMRMINWNGGE